MTPQDPRWKEVRAQFTAVNHSIYLNNASFAPGPISVTEATKKAIDDWSNGAPSWKPWEAEAESARKRFAELIGARDTEVALLPTVSLAAAQIAERFPWKSGGNLVIPSGEFRSNLFPWLQQERRGVEVREVPFQDGHINTENFCQAMDSNTQLVVFSSVQSSSGSLADIACISTHARSLGARVCVDGTQQIGALTFPLEHVDYLVVSGYKWLLAPRGTSFLYLREELISELEPLAPGWKSPPEPYANYYGGPLAEAPTAARFDQSLAWAPWVGANEGLRVLLELGIENIEARNLALADAFREAVGLAKPERPTQIVSLKVEDPETLQKKLAKSGVVAALRGDYLRLAFHFFNDFEEVEKVAELIH